MSVLAVRRAGVLRHPTSLPGPEPRGTFGADARRFVDWLAAGGFTVWQTLPLGVTDAYGSPYGLRSAYAGDPRFIDSSDLGALAELVGEDHVLFGSDYPHPEGLADPASYTTQLAGLPDEWIRKIMGENLAKLMRVPVPA